VGDPKNLIVGVAGPIGSGKGTVADWFKDKGFVSASLSDEIRIELKARGQDITRESMQEVGNELRAKFGNDVLAQRAWERLKSVGGQIILESIRHPDEAKYIKAKGNFYLISVTADQKTRYDRIAKRRRHGDPFSWEDFLQEDTEESMGYHGDHSQLVNKTAELADYVVDNSGTLEETYSQLAEILEGSNA
jgi:dephospho-CoA kinase